LGSARIYLNGTLAVFTISLTAVQQPTGVAMAEAESLG
jgi:hypothetical protein